MMKWIIGFAVFFLAIGGMVISGALSLAGDLIKVVAYSAFLMAGVLFVIGFFLYQKVKSRFGGGSK